MTKKQDQDRPKASGRYRKVEVRTWGDAKFRKLSPMPPCGQGLWLFLITGPHTGPIPGLFRAGRAAMAEELGWTPEAFDEAFREAFQQGMVEADFQARVMWVPNAIRHNKPESPNVVRSWAAEFDLIPECDLKWKAFEALKASIHALGEAYGKAFDETFPKPSVKASGKPSAKTTGNQEQEQEQEQNSSGEGGKPPERKSPEEMSKTELWNSAVSLLGGQGVPEPQARSLIGKLVKDYKAAGDDIVITAVRAAVAEQPSDARAYLKATCQRLAGERRSDGSSDWTRSAT